MRPLRRRQQGRTLMAMERLWRGSKRTIVQQLPKELWGSAPATSLGRSASRTLSPAPRTPTSCHPGPSPCSSSVCPSLHSIHEPVERDWVTVSESDAVFIKHALSAGMLDGRGCKNIHSTLEVQNPKSIPRVYQSLSGMTDKKKASWFQMVFCTVVKARHFSRLT